MINITEFRYVPEQKKTEIHVYASIFSLFRSSGIYYPIETVYVSIFSLFCIIWYLLYN